MSNVITNAVRALKMSSSAKAVLLALADHADDFGSAWPSIPKICEFTCLCERSVHAAIKWLESHGAITCDRSNGRHTTYKVTADKFTVTPAADAVVEGSEPPQQVHPRSKCAPASDAATPAVNAVVPPQQMQSPPQQMRSNHQEPSIEPSITTKRVTAPVAAMVDLPDWLPRTEWAAFVEMRKRIRSPLTDRAVTLLVGKLEELRTAGHSPAKVLDQSTMNGWKGVFEIKPAGSAKPAAKSGVHIGKQDYTGGWN